VNEGLCGGPCFGYLGDVVKVSQDAVLLGLELGLKVSPDQGNVVDHQLETAGGERCGHEHTHTHTHTIKSSKKIIIIPRVSVSVATGPTQILGGDGLQAHHLQGPGPQHQLAAPRVEVLPAEERGCFELLGTHQRTPRFGGTQG
jgi:hypothetical protein